MQKAKTQEPKTRDQLIALCKERKIKGYSGKKKDDILKLLTPPQAVETVQPHHGRFIINAIDLFCGCGGMSKGLTDAGINVIAGIDVWDKAIESYKKNNPTHLSLCKDLTTFSPQHFQELHNTPIDLIVGGPPCQGFSGMNRHSKTAYSKAKNSHVVPYLSFCDFFRPNNFVLENVEKLMNEHKMKTQELAIIKATSCEQMWLRELIVLEQEYTSYRMERDIAINGVVKTGGSSSKSKIVVKAGNIKKKIQLKEA
jgi:hypothetical protein